MTTTVPTLDTLSIGWPITRLGMSFFPVYLAHNQLPAITTGEASGLEVDELDEPSVQALRVRNPGDKPVLVVEGEHFLGNKQNRSVNVTVLVPSLGDVKIPVSCLEQGRWGRPQASRRMRRSRRPASAPRRTRVSPGPCAAAVPARAIRMPSGARSMQCSAASPCSRPPRPPRT